MSLRYERYRERARREYGHVYLMRCSTTGFSKIGWTLKHPAERLEDIRSEFRNGFDWHLVAAVSCFNPPRLEAALHRWLDHARVTDKREWFVLGKDDTWALLALFEAGSAPEFTRRAAESAWRKGYRQGIGAGRHLEELDRLDAEEWEAMTWDEQYERETEGVRGLTPYDDGQGTLTACGLYLPAKPTHPTDKVDKRGGPWT